MYLNPENLAPESKLINTMLYYDLSKINQLASDKATVAEVRI